MGDGLVTTRMVLAPMPAWRGIAGRARRAPRGPLVAGVGAALVLGVAGLAVASGAIGPGAVVASPSASSSASPSPAADALPSPTQRPSITAGPSAVPTASATAPPTTPPTPVATPLPTPVPTPVPAQSTYVVQQGDTLAAIAQQFGTTVAALQTANGIDDPNEIVIGQVLVIP